MKLFYSESLLDDDSLASDPVSLSDDAMMPYTMPFLASLVAHAAVALLRFSSVAAPSARLLLGFEINNNVQLAIGPNLSAHDPSGEGNILHLIAAIGASVDAGKFNLPLHVAFMPDKNKYNVFALTTGVNW